MVLKKDIEQAWQAQNALLMPKSSDLKRAFLEKFLPAGRHIEVISGIRRCGKSTLMRQIIHQLYHKTAYFNFEDSRIHGFDVNDFTKLDEIFGTEIEAYFFDEIQNVPSWEVFVRQLHDRGEKIYITGSNAALLSKELGTRLTGRYLRHELFPFSFQEFGQYKNLDDPSETFSQYTNLGGFPEYLDTQRPEILQNLLRDIVFRDIAVRYGLRSVTALMDLTLYLLSNIGKEVSYNNLRKTFSIGSANTVSDYLSWLADSYLLFYLPRFSWSAKSIAINPRKVYAVDNGLVNANSLSFSDDRGRLLENAVFLFLRQQNSGLFYFRENHECDFVVFRKQKGKLAIQVCEELNSDNLSRELNGLSEAMRFFGLEEGYIVTLRQQEKLQVDGKMVQVVTVSDFFRLDALAGADD
jgi:predicted AAA+ superfamily ATPase